MTSGTSEDGCICRTSEVESGGTNLSSKFSAFDCVIFEGFFLELISDGFCCVKILDSVIQSSSPLSEMSAMLCHVPFEVELAARFLFSFWRWLESRLNSILSSICLIIAEFSGFFVIRSYISSICLIEKVPVSFSLQVR